MIIIIHNDSIKGKIEHDRFIINSQQHRVWTWKKYGPVLFKLQLTSTLAMESQKHNVLQLRKSSRQKNNNIVVNH